MGLKLSPSQGKLPTDMSEIFVLDEQRKLIALAVRHYESEDLLQTLLADYPSLLAGDQIDPNSPRRWLLVKRELEVPAEEKGNGRWSLDHLFLDQDGVPTLVEVKRSSDTRIRREVVGQMLDYAANGVKYWPHNSIRTAFEATCQEVGIDAASRVADHIGPAVDPEAFWTAVKTNLQAGRIRMLFVADVIPDELRRVVEFLNEQMDPAEVLAVEIRQFASATLRTLVPRVIGRTMEAEDRKRGRPNKPKRKWDPETFFSTLRERGEGASIPAAQQLLTWAETHATRVWWGEGQIEGSFIPVCEDDMPKMFPFALYTSRPGGKPYVLLYFKNWGKLPPFQSTEVRAELVRRFNAIPGVVFSPDVFDGWSSIPLTAMIVDDVRCRFLSVIEWLIGQISGAVGNGVGTSEGGGSVPPVA